MRGNSLQDSKKFVLQNTKKSDDGHWRNVVRSDYM